MADAHDSAVRWEHFAVPEHWVGPAIVLLKSLVKKVGQKNKDMGSDDGDGDDGGRLDPITPNAIWFDFSMIETFLENGADAFFSHHRRRDDDFDQMDDDDDADVGDAEETQDAEETEILEEVEGFLPAFV